MALMFDGNSKNKFNIPQPLFKNKWALKSWGPFVDSVLTFQAISLSVDQQSSWFKKNSVNIQFEDDADNEVALCIEVLKKDGPRDIIINIVDGDNIVLKVIKLHKVKIQQYNFDLSYCSSETIKLNLECTFSKFELID